MKARGAVNGGSAIACLIKVKSPTRHSARKASIIESRVRARYMLGADPKRSCVGILVSWVSVPSKGHPALRVQPQQGGDYAASRQLKDFRIHIGAHVLYPGGDHRGAG